MVHFADFNCDMKQRTRTGSRFLLFAAVMLIGLSQFVYLPLRQCFGQHVADYARLTDAAAKQRQAYGAADYELLSWLAAQTPPEAHLLLITPTPPLAGDAQYVFYHRALVDLYPRTVWWIAPPDQVAQYPIWWSETDLSVADIRRQAAQFKSDVLLFEGFEEPLLPGEVRYFDEDTFLLFLSEG